MPNTLLLSLAPDLQTEIESKLETVMLGVKSSVMRPNEPISHVYFPTTGLISVVVALERGGTVETLTIANEGFSGIPVLLGQSTGTRDAFVQIAGEFQRLPTADFLDLLSRDARLRDSLQPYVLHALRIAEQSAACIAFHTLEARLARWLLSVNDRLPGRIPLTHESLSQMLGVYRPTVTLAIGLLQDARLISSRRGVIELLNRPLLEVVACECYQATVLTGTPTAL